MSHKRRIPWWRWLKLTWVRRLLVLSWTIAALVGVYWAWSGFSETDSEPPPPAAIAPPPQDLSPPEEEPLRAFQRPSRENVRFAVNAAYYLMGVVVFGLALMFALIIIYWEPRSSTVHITREKPLRRGKDFVKTPRSMKGSADEPRVSEAQDEDSSDKIARNYLQQRGKGSSKPSTENDVDEDDWDPC